MENNSAVEALIVKELVDVYNISSDNTWRKIIDIIPKDRVVDLDFNGTTIKTPWSCEAFKDVLAMKNVRKLIVYNDEDMANKLTIMCIASGFGKDKVKSVMPVVVKKKTKEELALESKGADMLSKFNYNESEDTYYLPLYETYSQLQNSSTVVVLEEALRQLKEKDVNASTVVIELDKMAIHTSVLMALAAVVIEFGKNGLVIDIDSNSEETLKDYNMHLNDQSVTSYTVEAKLDAFKRLKIGSVGILVKYKSTKAKDCFGRTGGGEVVSSRVAVYRGVARDKHSGKLSIVFHAYNSKDLYTKQHNLEAMDGDYPDTIPYQKLSAGIDDVGLKSMFLGSSLHFLEPIQSEKNESVMMHTALDNETVRLMPYTIPERIKAVFDDYDIEYDSDGLENAIKITAEKLK